MDVVDSQRVAMIDAFDVLNEDVGASFDRITRLAAFSLRTPVAFVSILGMDEQHFVSSVGLCIKGTPRSAAVCSIVVERDHMLAVEDLTADARFAGNPLVVGEPWMRSYLGAPLRLKNGITIGALCVMDTVPRVYAQAEQEQLATLADIVVGQLELRNLDGRRDPVSGLPNRQQFEIDLKGLIARSGNARLCAVLVDVFDISRTNEAGQVLGMKPLEALIRRMGIRLKSALDGHADVYHIGVTRFAFVMRARSRQDVDTLVASIRERLRRPLMAAGVPMSPQFHAGACEFDCADADADDVIRRTLIALNTSVVTHDIPSWYSPERDRAMQRNYMLATDSDRALKDSEFSLQYQPRIQIDGMAPISAEALMRWNHHTLGLISPGEFIPVFERTAVIRRLSRWVIEQAIDQLALWHARGIDLSVSINLSPQDLNDQKLAGTLQRLLDKARLPASALEVEITEGEWLRMHSTAERQLRQIAGAGIRVAIDDFGTGYSNFGYLAELPIHALKIDKSLIDGIQVSERAQVKVSAILKLAADLGYRTVAEGIETREQLDMLAGWGCNEAQGFLLARPMCGDELETYYRNGTARLPG